MSKANIVVLFNKAGRLVDLAGVLRKRRYSGRCGIAPEKVDYMNLRNDWRRVGGYLHTATLKFKQEHEQTQDR